MIFYYSKFVSSLGLCPHTPPSVTQYQIWKPHLKNPGYAPGRDITILIVLATACGLYDCALLQLVLVHFIDLLSSLLLVKFLYIVILWTLNCYCSTTKDQLSGGNVHSVLPVEEDEEAGSDSYHSTASFISLGSVEVSGSIFSDISVQYISV